MSDSTATASLVAESSSALNPVAMLAALGSKVRWPIIQLLADGTPRSGTEVASAFGRDFDGVSKHLRLMRAAGVVEASTGADRRLLLLSIPPTMRREPGVIDFGLCTVRLASVNFAPAKG